MNRRLCSFLTACTLTAALAVGAAAPASAAFADLTDTELTTAVAVLSGMGVVNGYSSGLYAPNDTLTRAQFCKMIVLATGQGSAVSKNSYRSLFNDVAASSWALGYINVAYGNGLISGYGNGNFGPEDGVTVAQAVTIILRTLGYTTADIGAFWPEDYISKADDLGLLAGIESNSNDTLTRGEAALLLYAMLQSDTASGSEFVRTVAASTVSTALVLDNDAESGDGKLGTAAIYQSGSVSYYEQSNGIDEELVGCRGTLLLNSSSNVIGFVPDGNSFVKITPAAVTAETIKASTGSSYTVSSSTAVVLDGEKTTYGECWYDLSTRDSITIFYSAAGAIDLIYAGDETKYEGVQLTGYYEDAYPSESSPSTITLLGVEFDVNSAALTTLKKFSVGEKMTVTLNAEGEILSAASATGNSAVMIGVLEDEKGTVELLNGITIQGSFSDSVSSLVGQLVRINASGIGTFSASALSSSTGSDLDVVNAKLGTKSLSNSAVIYECVGKSSVLEIELDDILTPTVSASKILYAGTDAKGLVNLLLLDDVTGDNYTYGMLSVGTKQTQSSGSSLSVTNRTVAVTNASGTTDSYLTGYDLTDGAFGGVAYSKATGKTTGAATLTKVKDVSRASFNGSDSVVVDGTVIPLSDEVQVYNTSAEKWVTLAQAKAFADTFTVYYDRTLTTGAKVRIIVTQ